MKKRYILALIICILIFVIAFIFSNNEEVGASDKLEGIKNFPSSYKPYLEVLAEKHPNWKFVALYTNLDWNYVISKENIFGKNLVPKNYSKAWKNTKEGQYNVEIDAGWVDSSKRAVEYCMDPRNFLNEVRIFQFEGLSYDSSTNNLTGIEKILYGTEFYNKKVSYLNSSGETINTSSKYSDLILKAGQTSKVSPYHLASRIKQEVGPFLTHKSISGNVAGYKGLYNFYNIGATSSTESLGAIKNGLQYAKDGNGASSSVKKKFLIPWNTKERAITGGGIFIGDSYINVGQNTIYLQKFDVNDDRDDELFWHQYMTNVLAPYSESKSIYNGYKNIGMLSSSLTFIIPVYDNMSQYATQSPDISDSDFSKDNTNVYCTANNVNIRTGPSTSYEVITTVSNDEKMTRIGRGKQTGDKWDKVILENGILGYIYQTYVTETPPVQIEQIKVSIDNNLIQKGEKKQLKVSILPEEASNHKLVYSSSNTDVAIVDSNGNIQGISSGKATITVKAKENNVKDEIEIEVYSKVTGIILNYEQIYMPLESTFELNAQIEPDDANEKTILYSSGDTKVASVDANGLITGNGVGKTTITLVSKENSTIKRQCEVIVVRKLEENEIQFDNSIKVDNMFISGLDYKHNSVKDINEKITAELEIEIVSYKDKILNDTDLIGTGSKIRFKEHGNVLQEYSFVLYGDANGDGKINSIDLLVIQRDILEIQKMQDIFKKASNIKKDGKKPNSVDLLLIQRHILKMKEIEQ